MIIRLATLNDITNILIIKDLAVQNMHQNQIFQWDDTYPSENILLQDISNNELFVIEDNNNLVGFACINDSQAGEYHSITWTTPSKAYVIHRLTINPNAVSKGYATQLMLFAEDLAKSQNISAMRIDTFSKNYLAQKLFSKLGYAFVGNVFFDRKQEPFYCYEKHIS